MFNILPFMEFEAMRNRPNAAVCPPAFACPTTAAGGAVASTPSGNATRAIVCYAGNMGSTARLPRLSGYVGTTCLNSGSIPLLSKADREAAYPTFVGYAHRIAGVNDRRNPVCPDDNSGYFLNGIICTFGRVRSAHVTDGLQNTLMLAERPIEVNNLLVLGNGTPCDTVGEWWSWGGWSYWKATVAPYKFIQGHPINDGCGAGINGPGPFGSRHDSTFAAAFCDGSVRQVGFEVDAVTVWRPLGSRNDGQILNLP
jgi:hypothetical protein